MTPRSCGTAAPTCRGRKSKLVEMTNGCICLHAACDLLKEVRALAEQAGLTIC